MYCQKCGTENKDGMAFCNSCGLSLQTLPAAAPVKDNRWTWKTVAFIVFLLIAFILVTKYWIWWMDAPYGTDIFAWRPF